ETEVYPERGFEWDYWQRQCHRELYSLVGHRGMGLPQVSWSPDGQRLATGSEDGTVQVWQALSGQELCFHKVHKGGISSIAWSRDGQRRATASNDGPAKVLEAGGGRELLTLEEPTCRVWFVAWSPNGQRLATGYGGGVGGQATGRDGGAAKVWDAA